MRTREDAGGRGRTREGFGPARPAAGTARPGRSDAHEGAGLRGECGPARADTAGRQLDESAAVRGVPYAGCRIRAWLRLPGVGARGGGGCGVVGRAAAGVRAAVHPGHDGSGVDGCDGGRSALVVPAVGRSVGSASGPVGCRAVGEGAGPGAGGRFSGAWREDGLYAPAPWARRRSVMVRTGRAPSAAGCGAGSAAIQARAPETTTPPTAMHPSPEPSPDRRRRDTDATPLRSVGV